MIECDTCQDDDRCCGEDYDDNMCTYVRCDDFYTMRDVDGNNYCDEHSPTARAKRKAKQDKKYDEWTQHIRSKHKAEDSLKKLILEMKAWASSPLLSSDIAENWADKASQIASILYEGDNDE